MRLYMHGMVMLELNVPDRNCALSNIRIILNAKINEEIK